MENTLPNLTGYDYNDVFWKDFSDVENSPYKLNKPLNGFRSMLTFLTDKTDFSEEDYPLPLGYMASLVRMNGGQATISVQNVGSYDAEIFKNYDMVSFYPMTALFNEVLELSERVKTENPATKITYFNSDQHQHEMLLCNPKAEAFGRVMMERHKSIDHILVGEAEASFIQLCEKVYNENPELNDVPSVLYRGESGEVKFSNAPIKPVDFTSLPFASRDHLEDHISKNGVNTASPRIQSSRGCIAPCLYCVESSSNITDCGRRKSVLKRDGETFVDEMEMLHKKYGVIFFNVIDSSMEDPGKKGIKQLGEVFDDVVDRDIEASFKIHLRGETVDGFDNEFLDKLKYAGVDIIIPGIESGLERELKTYRKITTPDQSANALRKLEEHGKFFSAMGYIMFSPILQLDELPEKMDYLKNLNHAWDAWNMTYSTLVYPGTKYHEFIASEGLEIEHDELATLIPYRFADERVGIVADEMSGLKLKHPEIIKLQKSIMDSKNVGSRFYNKMNKPLMANLGAFEKFEGELKDITNETGDYYYDYFMELVDLARGRDFDGNVNALRESHIGGGRFNGLAKRSEDNLEDFLSSCDEKGLSTDKLFLRTWMSLMVSKANIAGGRIVKS